ncbi:GNAT family N-acetyltransferase [Gallaecimonas kandeliae]|uniref:GNAT family N-acetyltransferase n=1 Tax=Gallaecimonas kandeliae TaxID=3029055 RepID=UPI002648B223|nr:GNAT family N-acetyltransferase [Gallaecimonas kandeliae]WKE65588.1 GNAT family N-acetyltransferase [Gallaecimonas kandeliae]
MHLRQATPADAAAIWELRRLSLLAGCRGFYPDDLLEAWAGGPMPADFAQHIRGHWYLIEEGQQLLASGTVNLDSGRLDGLLVHPEAFRQGLGKWMMAHLELLARQHGLDSLSLDASLNAVPFYSALGFEGGETGFYQSPRGMTLACMPMRKSLVDTAPQG